MTAPVRRRNKSGEIGTAAETAVVRWLQDNGWPGAERRRLRGVHDAGDVTGMPGLLVEIKGGRQAAYATDDLIAHWLRVAETKLINARADLAVLVVKRRSIGEARAGEWWAIVHLLELAPLVGGIGWRADVLPNPIIRMTLAEMALVLRAAGYGTPLDGGTA